MSSSVAVLTSHAGETMSQDSAFLSGHPQMRHEVMPLGYPKTRTQHGKCSFLPRLSTAVFPGPCEGQWRIKMPSQLLSVACTGLGA